MRNKEKIPTIKKETIIDELQKIKDKAETIKEKDKLYSDPFLNIEIEELDKSITREDEKDDGIYSSFLKGDYEVARAKVQVFKEDGRKMRNSSNAAFIQWIDDKIEEEIRKKENEDFKQLDVA